MDFELPVDPFEIAAAAISLVAVWWTTRRDLLCWPIGIVSVLMYAAIYARAHLYSDALLQFVFGAFLVYGWWHWWRAPREQGLPVVVPGGRRELVLGICGGLAGWAVLGWFMSRHTDADFAWLDAGLAAFSLVAQFWAARLLRANWLLWIAVDVIYVGMYAVKGLPATAVLYAVFIVLAVRGWREWGRGTPA